MNCPVCPDQQLIISSREGVEIDYCGQCRGVWLDRGELDKILDRVAASPAAVGAVPSPAAPRPEPRDDRYRDDDRYRGDDRSRDDDRYRGDDRYRSPKKRKRGSFLEDLFDFD
jgi:Zn-finger nucleic acid-binding protein